MIPVLYEIKRAFTSKTVLILMAVIILFSLAVAFGTAAISSVSTSNGSGNFTAYGYGSNGTYNITTNLQNSFGQGISGSHVNVTVGSKVYQKNTDGNGYANFTLPNVPLSDFSGDTSQANYGFLNWNFTIVGSPSPVNSQLIVYFNQTNPYFFNETSSLGGGIPHSSLVTRYSMRNIGIQNHQSEIGLNIFYQGAHGSPSQPVKLYYLAENASNAAKLSSLPTEKNMTYFGTYSGFTSININPSSIGNSSGTSYEFVLFTPNGTYITEETQQVSNIITNDNLNSLFFTGEMEILGIFIPLMAGVSAYMTYGKDRTGQVLESVLVRPISRRGLISSRYLANVAAVFLAAVISFVASSLVYYHYLGKFLPAQTVFIGLWAVFVGIAGFIGLVYLASGFLKSQGALLGFVIGIYFVFDLFWSFLGVIPSIILYELKIPGGTIHGEFVTEILQYISPSGFMTIARDHVLGTSTLVTTAVHVNLSQIGITTMDMIVAGIVWIVVPLALSIYVYMKRD